MYNIWQFQRAIPDETVHVQNLIVAGIFHEDCILRKSFNNAYVVDTSAANTLDSQLESFYAYAEGRNKKGEKYSVQTLLSIRGGLRR